MSDSSTEIRVRIADYAVAADGVITTIGLGSCVAIVLHDPVARVGGLAHVLLPDASMSRDQSNPAKFPRTAVPVLLREMVELGANQARIRAKIAGGASMFGALVPTGGINIGERNIAAVREVLAEMNIPLIGDDTGADYGRSVYLFVADGRVEVRSLRRSTRVL